MLDRARVAQAGDVHPDHTDPLGARPRIEEGQHAARAGHEGQAPSASPARACSTRDTRWERLGESNLARMPDTWRLAAWTEMPSSVAISWFEQPATRSSSTSPSRRLR